MSVASASSALYRFKPLKTAGDWRALAHNWRTLSTVEACEGAYEVGLISEL